MGREFELQNLSVLKDSIEEYLSSPEEIVPRGRVVNVFVAIKALTPLLIRTEGQGDVTAFRLGGVSVPAILNTKVQAMLRRKTLRLLRHLYDNDPDVKKHVEELLGGEWQCIVNVTGGSRGVGYCGRCPACLIYGFAVQGGDYNVKSRVEGDVYYAVMREEDATFTFTRNAVDEALHVTGQALLQDRAVKPGVLFVGKIALKNLTWNELLLVLYSLATIDRLGAVQTHFGRVAVEIAGLIAAPYEVGSGYEAALKILSSAPKTPEEALTTYKGYIREIGKATPYAKYCISSGIAETVRREAVLKDIVKKAWSDAKAKHDELAKLAGGEGKKKGKK